VRVGRTSHSITGGGAASEFAPIEVSDSGQGMDEETRSKIFDPFFTTKTRGTGLGLPTAKRIIELHAGSIDIDCPPTGGTIVHITLPLSQRASP